MRGLSASWVLLNKHRNKPHSKAENKYGLPFSKFFLHNGKKEITGKLETILNTKDNADADAGLLKVFVMKCRGEPKRNQKSSAFVRYGKETKRQYEILILKLMIKKMKPYSSERIDSHWNDEKKIPPHF